MTPIISKKYQWLFIAFICLTRLVNSYAQTKEYFIKGKISDFPVNDIIYLIKGQYLFNGRDNWHFIDSTRVQQDSFFHFKGKVEEPGFYLITSTGQTLCNFILEPGANLTVYGDTVYTSKVIGSPATDLYKNFISNSLRSILIKKINSAADSARLYYKESQEWKYHTEQNKKYHEQLIAMKRDFIKNNPTSFYALWLMQYNFESFSDKEVRSYLDQLPANLKNHSIAQEINYGKFQQKKELEKKWSFYDFEFYNMSKNKVDLAPYKGKYILLDFWASWCGPCIQNLPTIKEIYEEYNSKSFSVISVAIHSEITIWMKGFNKHPFPWLNISDLKEWKGLMVKYYKINTIPRYILLDPQGYPVYDDLKINELKSKIKSTLERK